MRLRVSFVTAALCAVFLFAPVRSLSAAAGPAASGTAAAPADAGGTDAEPAFAPATEAGRKAARLKAQAEAAKDNAADKGEVPNKNKSGKKPKGKKQTAGDAAKPSGDANAADPNAPSACPPTCTTKHKAPPSLPPLPAVTGKASGPQGDSWESLAKLPNFSGVWLYDLQPAQVTAQSTDIVPLTPPFAARMEHDRALSRAGGDLPATAYHCMPRGVPEIMELATRAYEFLMTPNLITIVPQNNEVRFIYMDGRKPAANLKKSWNGFSTGHWEGDMLVVDTTAIRPGTDMFYGFPGGTEQHVIERFKRISDAKLQLDTTVADPTALTKPYTFTRTFTHTPFAEAEEVCLRNNRDLAPLPKQPSDLAPPGAKKTGIKKTGLKKPHPAKPKTPQNPSAAGVQPKDTP